MKAYSWDVKNRSRMGRYLTTLEMDFIQQCLRPEAKLQSILDVGAGSGRFAVPLQHQGFNVIGTEVDRLPLWWLQQSSPHTPVLLTSPQALRWPIKATSVDCVLAMEVPFVGQPWFWEECARVLRSDGLVITSTTNRHSYKGALYRVRPLLRPFLSRQGKRWAERQDFYHLAISDIILQLERHNFQLEQIAGLNWLPVGRTSESFLVPFWASLEQRLGLRRLAVHSPWVLLKARAG